MKNNFDKPNGIRYDRAMKLLFVLMTAYMIATMVFDTTNILFPIPL